MWRSDGSFFNQEIPYLQTIDVPVSGASSSLWDIPTLRYVHLYTISLPRRVQIPQTLRELRMCATYDEKEKDPMPILEMLPCLVLLELGRFRPETMSFGAQGFPRLQELLLERCSINKWAMEVGTMPKLSCLSFSDCWHEEGIPDGLLHLPSLRFVSVDSNHLRFVSVDGDRRNDSTLDGLRHKGCKIRGRYDILTAGKEE